MSRMRENSSGGHKDRISVVFPTYNHGHFLDGMLSALLSQSLKPYEIIVVDDGSTDDSLITLKRFERENPEVKVLVNETNRGAVAAVNRAVSHASGDFVFATAADDTVLPGFFEASLAMLNKHTEAGMSFTGRRSETEDGEWVKPGQKSAWGPSQESTYISPNHVRRIIDSRGIFIVDTTNIYRSEVLADFLPWSTELGPFTSSYAAHTIALQRGICYIPTTYALRRVSDTQYATHAMRDIEGALSRTNVAVSLMETEYPGLWPRKFVTNYRRSEARRIAHFLLSDTRARQAETISRIGTLIGYRPSLLARLSLLMLRATTALSNTVDAAFLKWKFRPTPGAIMDRIKWKLGRG